jgi:ribosomal protein S18 acetylase RimI-like enzyme
MPVPSDRLEVTELAQFHLRPRIIDSHICVASLNAKSNTLTVLAASADQQSLQIRRELYDGDDAAIVELHRRVYVPEYGRNDDFVAQVAAGLDVAIEAGWPEQAGAVWLVERTGEPELLGSMGLTHEGDGLGRVRWFVLDPSVRGHGLGRSLLAQLLADAHANELERLELETFSALKAAASLYREAGFRVEWERERTDWGPPITYQHYSIHLR